MGQLVEGGESFEPPEAKDVLFMPVRLRKQLAVLERLRRQAADYIKRKDALTKGERDGCTPLSRMAARDLKTLLGARNLPAFGNKADRVARLIEFAQRTPLSYYPYWKGAPLENAIPPVPPNTFVDVVLVFKALTGPKHLWEKLSNRKIQEEPLRWAACFLFAAFWRKPT